MQPHDPENRFGLPEDEKEARLRRLRARFAAATPRRSTALPRRRLWSRLRWWQWAVVVVLVLALALLAEFG